MLEQIKNGIDNIRQKVNGNDNSSKLRVCDGLAQKAKQHEWWAEFLSNCKTY